MLAFSAFSGGRVEVRARAKVNLGLEVLGRRADGYHELRSLMWAIELADRVTLEAGGADIALECAAPGCPADSGQSRVAGGRARAPGDAHGGRASDSDREAHPGGGGSGRRLRGRGGRSRRVRAPPEERARTRAGWGPWRWRSAWTCPSSWAGARRWRRGRGEELRPRPGEHGPVARAGEPGLPAGDARRLRAARAGRLRRRARVDALVTALRRGVGGGRGHRDERARARGGAALARAGRGEGGAPGGRVPGRADVGQRPDRDRDRPIAPGGAPDPGSRWARGRGGSGSRARSPARC